MKKLIVVLMMTAFLGSTGLVFAEATGTTGQATPAVKSEKKCDKTKKECKGKKGKKVCTKNKKEATPNTAPATK